MGEAFAMQEKCRSKIVEASLDILTVVAIIGRSLS